MGITELLVQLGRLFAGCKNSGDWALFEQPGNIVWNRLPNAVVIRAFDVTRGEHVPQRNMVSQEQALFLIVGVWQSFL